jgi:hypothetical protein
MGNDAFLRRLAVVGCGDDQRVSPLLFRIDGKGYGRLGRIGADASENRHGETGGPDYGGKHGTALFAA